jgi:hypothetical protein
MLKSHRGVIDIIFGEVFVVLARFLATEVVTLRCSRLSDILFTPFNCLRNAIITRYGRPSRDGER